MKLLRLPQKAMADIDDLIAIAEAARSMGEAEALATAAHELMGTASNLGTMALASGAGPFRRTVP
ncbi:MAG: hypothetical protein EA405_00205 [Rhodospirillales bacterium]|nr:MAG: hypothetical protein EA405_00205 [Rhodospirillales bacterium]